MAAPSAGTSIDARSGTVTSTPAGTSRNTPSVQFAAFPAANFSSPDTTEPRCASTSSGRSATIRARLPNTTPSGSSASLSSSPAGCCSRQVGIEPAQVRVAPGLVAVGRNRQRLIALERRRALAREPGRLRHRLRHPTEPSICSWISRFSSTAYSSGSSFVIGSTNPETIIAEASSSDSPRLIR